MDQNSYILINLVKGKPGKARHHQGAFKALKWGTFSEVLSPLEPKQVP